MSLCVEEVSVFQKPSERRLVVTLVPACLPACLLCGVLTSKRDQSVLHSPPVSKQPEYARPKAGTHRACAVCRGGTSFPDSAPTAVGVCPLGLLPTAHMSDAEKVLSQDSVLSSVR
jgi:hypothetical protein